MANKSIDGDVRRFIIINTTEYNGDGKYGVIDCSYNELADYGFRPDDETDLTINNRYVKADDMGIGEVAESTSYRGAYLMRIA